MMTVKAKAVAALMAVALLFAAGWKLRDLQADAEEGARLKAQEETRKMLSDLAADVSKQTEQAISQIRVTNQTIHQKAIHEVQTNTVYRDCKLPADGLRIINEARAAANASIGAVPAAAPAK